MPGLGFRSVFMCSHICYISSLLIHPSFLFLDHLALIQEFHCLKSFFID